MIVSMEITRPGSSPKLSYVRPQRASRDTQTHGENAHGMPVARVSSAVTWPIRSTSRGSRVAPRPMLCGKTVAPSRFPWPWTESTPYTIGICSRVVSACAWKVSTVSAHASGVFWAGTEPPPESTEPSRRDATSVGSGATAPRSACVI